MEEGIRQKSSLFSAPLLRYFVAFSLVTLETWIINTSLFPRFNDIFPETRDISTLVYALTLLLITFQALRNTRLFKAAALLWISLILLSLGYVLALLGIRLVSLPLVLVGSCLMNMGNSLILILLGVAFIRFDSQAAFFCIAFASLASTCVQFLLGMAPAVFCLGLLFLIPFVVAALIFTQARATLQRIGESAAPSDLSVTNPSSFLPLSHKLFISFFLFAVASGYALTFRSVASNPPQVFLSFIPLAVIVVFALLRRLRVNIDSVFLVSVLLILGGYLSIPALPTQFPFPVANTLLHAGSSCFQVMTWCVLIAVGKRNPTGVLPLLSYGLFASALGTLAGTSLGHLTNAATFNYAQQESLVACSIVLAVIGFCLVGLRSFSFERTIEGVAPVKKLVPSTKQGFLERGCDSVAEKYKLTPREIDVLALLARGRNGHAIQEKLVVSRSTVKTHVRNIYTKLDVHSQQELIDLVERE